MTKAELINALQNVPDDTQILFGYDENFSVTSAIENLIFRDGIVIMDASEPFRDGAIEGRISEGEEWDGYGDDL